MDKNRISVDAEALENTAGKVDSSVSAIRDNINRFRTVIEGLNSTWSSDVKDKFFTSYDKDLRALNEMVTQYSEVAAGLRNMANYYRQNEEKIKSEIEKARKACG